MIHLLGIAKEIQGLLEKHNLPFCFIGGLALQRWAEPRITQDVDLTIITGFSKESEIIDLLFKKFEARVDNAKEFALINRVLLLKSKTGIGIDISLGAIDFEIAVVERATYHNYTGKITLKTCAAEDLVIMKAFANRLKDWADIDSIIRFNIY